jgi:hypothetical protein
MRALKFAMVVAFFLGQPVYANVITYTALLLGPSESPPNASPGIGEAIVTIDTVLQTMEVRVTFSGLLGITTASHIHCCTASPDTGTANVATTTPTFAGFPLGVTSGSYDKTLDLTASSSYNPSFVSGDGGGTVASSEAVLLAAMAAGDTYLNIHSSVLPGGEIRGFLAPAPEPGTLLAAGVALAGIVMFRRKRAAW